MSEAIDLKGKQFGRLRVIRFLRLGHEAIWLCICNCGRTKEVPSSRLRSGYTKSCGCLHRERTRSMGLANKRHGLCNSPTYESWASARSRTLNPRSDHFQYYAGRGIDFSPEWQEFESFLRDMGERPPGTMLDRIDNNQGYRPGNCRWATPTESSNNRSSNRTITFMGQTATLAEWARRSNLSPATLWQRLKRGWPLAKAINRGEEPWRGES